MMEIRIARQPGSASQDTSRYKNYNIGLGLSVYCLGLAQYNSRYMLEASLPLVVVYLIG